MSIAEDFWNQPLLDTSGEQYSKVAINIVERSTEVEYWFHDGSMFAVSLNGILRYKLRMEETPSC